MFGRLSREEAESIHSNPQLQRRKKKTAILPPFDRFTEGRGLGLRRVAGRVALVTCVLTFVSPVKRVDVLLSVRAECEWRDRDVTVLQILQVQRVMKSHEVRMTGDPPEGHVVLEREKRREKRKKKNTNEHNIGGKNVPSHCYLSL